MIFFSNIFEKLVLQTDLYKQESIPEGCVPPALYRGRGLCQGGVSAQGGLCQGDPLPSPRDTQV